MATPQFSAACPPASHPRASEGYGKRYPDRQPPTSEPDFSGLPSREAAIACYIDRLPEGAAIGYKTLASVLPAYGQQACSSALRNLSAAGHLRRIREHLTLHDRTMRWVTRTYWSREPHDDTWWAEFARRIKGIDVTGARGEGLAWADQGAREAPDAPDTPPPAPPTPPQALTETPEAPANSPADGPAGNPAAHPAARPAWLAHPDEADPQPRTERPRTEQPRQSPAPETAASTPGYRALARLAHAEPRLTLSAAECDALAPLADQWLQRRVRPEHLTLALTSGLPQGPIHSPAAFLRSRLEKKMPPLPADSAPASAEETAAQPGRVTRVIMLCTTCDQDETTVPLTDGLCPDCHALLTDERADIPADIPATFLAQPPRASGPEVPLGEVASQLLSR
ncbi:hypothetical protein ABZ114_24415 [Streptomyces albidoflavus]|uniref:hypothetical protein n=1 Tax=Streptomyces TaxID=1883 RepID=UPI00063E7800|nr:hypothetical protein [Streptomyces sp. KE1]KLJ03182.1 hypothetical protein WQ59_10005 [Streptomyces sp. KE1]